MDRFDAEAKTLKHNYIIGDHDAGVIARWGRKLYAEAHAAGLAEGEAKLALAEKAIDDSMKASDWFRLKLKEAEAKLAAEKDAHEKTLRLRTLPLEVKLAALTAENKRMREALQSYVDDDECVLTPDGSPDEPCPKHIFCRFCRGKKALFPEPEKPAPEYPDCSCGHPAKEHYTMMEGCGCKVCGCPGYHRKPAPDGMTQHITRECHDDAPEPKEK
jgi:hypothetical protein